MKTRTLAAWATGAGLLLAVWSHGACLAPEGLQAIFFPTLGYRAAAGQGWIVPVHGWLFRAESQPLRQRASRAALRKTLRIPESEKQNPYFLARSDFFLVRSLKSQVLNVGSEPQMIPLKASDAGGHVLDQIRLPETWPAGWQTLEAHLCEAGAAPIALPIQLIEPQGRLVVSDLDDTIKVTQVGKRAALVAQTFLKPFAAVPGMAEVYRRWEKEDPSTVYCYLSASPWPLYPALETFLREAGFPRGVLRLKRLRLKDRSFFSLFESPVSYKTPLLEELFQRFPGRMFILVGDSGEKDPEIYAAIARKYPQQIQHIYIRHTAAAPFPERFAEAFAGIPAGQWTLFRDPKEMH